MSAIPRVVILGRPNVGKSTLFNRICGRRRALVGNEPGMTRDRIYARAEWMGKAFEVVDTGGLCLDQRDTMASHIFSQARTAIDEASQLVLVADGQAGVTALDMELARLLRREGKPLTLAVNKIDSNSALANAAEFHRLGIPAVFPLSAEHGTGVDDLLDYLTISFSASSEEPPRADPAIKIAIIGRPNVGKSTLLNRLVGRERSIVTPTAGTTRDAVDAEVENGDRRFRVVDTAGIRRKGKTRLMAEKLSVIQARKHLERSDLALLLLDAVDGITALDTHIGGYAHESLRSIILVVNKWDVVKKGPTTTRDFSHIIRRRLKYLDYAPIVFLSALSGQHLNRLFKAIVEVADARKQRVGTSEMNRFLETLNLERVPGPSHKPLRLYYLTQAGTAPPVFVAFTNEARPLYFSVARYLENRIRERFGFSGTPILIKTRFKSRKSPS